MDASRSVVLEITHHEARGKVELTFEEWQGSRIVRLGIRSLILLINLNRFWFPGHITLRPLWWWADQWKSHFTHVSTTRNFTEHPAVYGNTGQYNQQWTLWYNSHR